MRQFARSILPTAHRHLTLKQHPRAYSIRTDILASMATAYQIQVPARDTGLWKSEQTQEAADKVTELLQRDLEVRASPGRVRRQQLLEGAWGLTRAAVASPRLLQRVGLP